MKHIGVAVAEKSENFAFPLTTIEARAGKPDMNALDLLFNEWKPEEVVVGLPLNMDGSETKFVAAVRRFADQLADQFGVQISLVDERLTSFEASQRTGDAMPDHAVAAQVIAESWLNGNL